VRNGGAVDLRIVFAVEPARESEVRARIDKALASGFLTGPAGAPTRWSLLGTKAGVLTAAEREQAKRIAT
jgi:hypothetical protein